MYCGNTKGGDSHSVYDLRGLHFEVTKLTVT